MEVFLLIIIIILLYLLLRKKSSNNFKEDLSNGTIKYAKALKEAAKTFQENVSDSDNENIINNNKNTIDNFDDFTKAGIMLTSKIISKIYNNISDEFKGKIPLKVWRDEKVAGFNAMLISYMLKKYVSNKSQHEKGLAVGMVYEFLVGSENFKSVFIEDFNNLVRNPTELSSEGTALANILIDILIDTDLQSLDRLMNEKNPIIKEALTLAPAYIDKGIDFGEEYNNLNAEVATALIECNLNEHIIDTYKKF